MADERKEWTPSRMEDEIRVHCRMCNGYLWSTDRYTSGNDGDYVIDCPRWKNGKCGHANGGR